MLNMKIILRLFSTIFSAVIIFGMLSCNTSRGLSLTGSKVEDFDKFYDRFHKDVNFQMSRIKFPLEGEYVDGAQTEKWDKNNWIMMKEKIYDIDRSQFKVQYKKTEDSFFQKVWLENAGFSAEYRFELIGKKWYLVYAVDRNL